MSPHLAPGVRAAKIEGRKSSGIEWLMHWQDRRTTGLTNAACAVHEAIVHGGNTVEKGTKLEELKSWRVDFPYLFVLYSSGRW